MAKYCKFKMKKFIFPLLYHMFFDILYYRMVQLYGKVVLYYYMM